MLGVLTEQTEEGHSTQRFHFSSLIFSTYTACLLLPYHVVGHATLQLHSCQSTCRLVLTISAKILLPKNKVLLDAMSF